MADLINGSNGNGVFNNGQFNTTTVDPDTLKRSVKAADAATSPYNGFGGVWQILLPMMGGIGDLPQYWSPRRDQVLRATIAKENMWASAVHIATTKAATTDWRLDGKRVRRFHDLINEADGNNSFVSFQEKQVRDFLLTDNGCFTEIVYATVGSGSRIIGINHLDSLRTIRTGDPAIPVIYADRLGRWHEMKDYQVFDMADEPDTGLYFYNIGFCAASRCYLAILKMAALEQYIYEKVTGKRPLDIALVNANINEQQLQNAMDAQQQAQAQKGYVQYGGVVMIPILDPTANAQVAHIPIAGLPDGFKVEEERINGKLTYAAAIGIDPNELDPQLTNRKNSLGTGSQAQILDDKQATKGINAFRKKQEYLFNDRLLPSTVSFSTYGLDLVDMQRRAAVAKTNAEAMRALVGNGIEPPIITPEQAKNKLVDTGDIPSEFLTEEISGDETLRDTDKPLLTLDQEGVKPHDAGLMQTEQQPAPAPFGNGPQGAKPKGMKPTTQVAAPKPAAVKQATKEFNDLINAAEEYCYANGYDVDVMTDKELVTVYVAHVQ